MFRSEAEAEVTPRLRVRSRGRFHRLIVLGLLVACVAACGGGGGGSAPTTLTQRTRAPAPQPSPTVQSPPPTSSTGAVTFSNLEGMRTSARAAVADNPREDYMLACTVQLRNGNECSLLTLPLIGMEFADPDVEDIMSRVLVLSLIHISEPTRPY